VKDQSAPIPEEITSKLGGRIYIVRCTQSRAASATPQVRRNKKRFPSDFMFQLTLEEVERLRSQIATLKSGRGQHRKYSPYAFTEQGVAMLSSVLHSERAIQVNIAIMRAFVQLREMIGSNKTLARRLNELEKKYDSQFRVVFEAIRSLMAEPEPKVKRIGFKT
jgi:phage regulator Rha-like protein